MSASSETMAKRHRQTLRKRAARKDAYKRSFGDFPSDTIYRDPLGMSTGEPVTFQKDWGSGLDEPVDWGVHTPGRTGTMSIRKKWDELQNKGFSIKETTDVIAKTLDTGDWQLPLDILEDTFIVKPEQTPAAEFIPRVTTQDDRVHATPVTDHPEPEFGLEGTAGTDGDGNRVYAYDDPSYTDLAYDVLGYGVASRISDKIILASQNLRSPEQTTEESLLIGHRQKTERQIIWGTNATNPGDGDAAGWDGFADMGVRPASVGSISESDYGDAAALKEYVQQLVDVAEFNGADKENLAVFLPFDAHRTLSNAFEDLLRYETMEELDTGFSTFTLDGGLVPVFKTSAIPRIQNYPDASTEDAIFVVNMDSVALYQLQEPTLNPLANLGPEERVAADQYNTLVSQSGDGNTRDADHVVIGQVDTA